ncbi:hypothetical protein [Paractinoplanes atraurantiacus]|uniref:Uncharacterized protein n=1 Tax=Paractinoplanes atraurantiacus TaxID=1036182 RepID=A0A285IZA2_9ACTN|nr:hypothetical protein [Actinoplanes atraurantiacus]SNY53153.1 hypothetical protein SAMN05421748_113197 [Actinoplanes atraurantiacus]
MNLWEVKRSGERAQWTVTPLVSVGPLSFGATHGEVVAALDGEKASITFGGPPEEAHFDDAGVTTYYAGGRLYCVAVDALSGPQVLLEGTALAGRAPSAVEQWAVDQARTRQLELRYTHAGDPLITEYSVILRAQRAGDIVLSRPVFLEKPCDVAWDYVPPREWQTF